MKENIVFFISYLVTTAIFLILNLFALDGGDMVFALSVITVVFTIAFIICFIVMNFKKDRGIFKGIIVAIFFVLLAVLLQK